MDPISYNDNVVITGTGLIYSQGKGSGHFYKSIMLENAHGNSSVKKGGSDANCLLNIYENEKMEENSSSLFNWIIYCINTALKESKLTLQDLEKSKTRVILGTFLGEIGALRKEEIGNFKSFDNVANEVADYFNLNIETTIISSACASSAIAIGLGYESIRSETSDIVIAGGYEKVGEFTFAGMNSLKTLSNKISPFDKSRNGTMLGSGAGVIIIERDQTARKRKARIHAQILGCGITNDAINIVRPDITGAGVASAIIKSLNHNKNRLSQIDYVNAHGTGTFYNDIAESNGIKLAVTNNPPVSSIKPVIGHTLGASGVLECIASIYVIKHSKIPPTLNLTNADEECDLFLIKDKPYKKKVNTLVTNSLGFGGVNCTLALGKYNIGIHPTRNKSQRNDNHIVISNYNISHKNDWNNNHSLLENISFSVHSLIMKSAFTTATIERCGIIIDVKEGLCKSQELFMNQLITKGERLVSPVQFIQSFPGYYVGEICKKFNIKGPSITICDSKANIDNLIFLSETLIADMNSYPLIVGKIFDSKLFFFIVEHLDSSIRKTKENFLTLNEFKIKSKEIINEHAI